MRLPSVEIHLHRTALFPQSNSMMQRNSLPLMETEGSLPCSQELPLDPLLSQVCPDYILTPTMDLVKKSLCNIKLQMVLDV
jgi:hypothetical protein